MRHGYARFLIVSAALHAVVLVGLPVRVPTTATISRSARAPTATAARPEARPGPAPARSFTVLDWRAAPASPDAAPVDARAGGAPDARPDVAGLARELEAAVLSSADGPRGPRAGAASREESEGRFVPPVPVAVAWPEFPASAARSGAAGTVVLRVHVTTGGTVDDVLVVRGDAEPDAERAAVEAARRLLFEPALRDGVPVEVWFTYPVRFDP